MVKNYMMFYKIDEHEKRIDAIRFLYGRSGWKNILELNNTERN
jgi:hypothetical protein